MATPNKRMVRLSGAHGAVGLVGGSTAPSGVHRVPEGEADPVRWLVRHLG